MRPSTAWAKSGFTLIELMIAVCIIGVLASIAIPSFSAYTKRARATEVPGNLGSIYRGMKAYWEGQHGVQGLGATASTHCAVDDGGSGGGDSVPPMPPGPQPRTAPWGNYPSFAAVGFAPSGPVYAIYAWGHAPANEASLAATMGCGLSEAYVAVPLMHVIWGGLDLDGDGRMGGYTLQVGIKGEELFRQPGFGTVADGFDTLGMGACAFCAADNID